MTNEEFYMVFKVMCEYFSSTPSEALTEIYWQEFKDWKFENFKGACTVVMRSRVYSSLPKIAEITEAIHGKPADKAAIAYHQLVETMKRIGPWETVIFEDGAIGMAIEAMGGWEYANGITVEEWKFRRKDFESLYSAHANKGNVSPVKCIGAFDRINGANGQEGMNRPILATRDMKFIPGGQPETGALGGQDKKVLSFARKVLEGIGIS